jgi:hypothetical protein
VYTRKDRAGFWISWTHAQGRRRQRKTDAQNITRAKSILSAELLRVEQARMLGHTPPSEETFKEVADRIGANGRRSRNGLILLTAGLGDGLQRNRLRRPCI